MMNFFDQLLPEIPVLDAAEYFSGLTKSAEWTDPPDMTGELEGQFCCPVEQVIDKLKQVISTKFRKMVAYYTYAQSFRGPWWRGVKIEFSEHAEDEQEGAEFYVKRAVALGGPVHMDPIEPPPPSNDALGILKTMMRAEQEAIMAQRELRALVGDENPMKIAIEEHMAKDQHHLDELHQHLTQLQSQQLEAEGAPLPEPELPLEEEEAPVPAEPSAELEEIPKEAVSGEWVKKMVGGASASPERLRRFGKGQAAALNKVKKKLWEESERKGLQDVVDIKSGETLHEKAINRASNKSANRMTAMRAAKERLTPKQAAALPPFAAIPPAVAAAALLAAPAGAAAGLYATLPKQTKKQIAQEFRDPRLYSNVRGAATLESRGDRVKAHKKLDQRKDHTVLSAMREGFTRGKKKEAEELPKEASSDDELKEKGRQRAVTSLAAEAHRERARRGERFGGLGGRAAGTLAGGAAGLRASQGMSPGGRLAAATIGALGGGSVGKAVGKELGTERDIRKNASVSAMKLAWAKLADAEAQSEEAAAMSAPSAQEMQPQHYLQAEMVGQQAQAANEAGFYRQQLAEVQQQAQGMAQQVQQAQMQLQQVQQQAAQTGAQVQQAAQEAMQARDEAVMQSMEAAKARIGAQKMRQQFLEIASQDPAQLGEESLSPQVGDPMMAQDSAAGGMPPDAGLGAPPPAGPAGLAPAAQQAPAAPPGGAMEEGAAMPAEQMKMGNARLIGGVLGAASGVGSTLAHGAGLERSQARLQGVQDAQDGSFRQAAALALAKQDVAGAELARSHPGRSALKRGISGAVAGSIAGPAMLNQAKSMRKDLPDAARGFLRMFGK